ncbi:MAG: hypothetical protein K5987_09725 [Lachnospiraceae bacterium]|nr:hypothetical protein [Lachnospiraceae bacterium]
MQVEYEFFFKDEIDEIRKHLTNIKDERTVVMAPKIGDSKGNFNTKLRMYSYGGRILELSTTRCAKCCYLPDDKYIPTGSDIKSGSTPYEEITEDSIREAISLARIRANEGKKTYEERSVETALIYKNRQQEDPSAIIIDMEFNCPKDWLGNVVSMRNNKVSTTGKPDLVIYDKESKSFGIVELKYKNKSCGNMEKHFVDFTNIVKSHKVGRIKAEFRRKINYLEHYGFIPEIPEMDLDKAENTDIWMAFLFVDGNYESCLNRFQNTRLRDEIDRGLFGFKHYQSLDQDMDFSRKAFGL